MDHLYEILFAAEITKERLLVFAQRLINDVAQVSNLLINFKLSQAVPM